MHPTNGLHRTSHTTIGPLTIAVALLALTMTTAVAQPPQSTQPPPLPREFRGAWVATVANIDWPSKRTLNVEQQQAELRAIVQQAAELNLNALIFQVRPACDALYESKLEPWSEYLTGQMGQPPKPGYDPLQQIIRLAHAHSIEVHAWFNPYRALHPAGKGAVSDDHISRTQPKIVREYGDYLWLDPGEPAAVAHTLSVMMDVVERYNVDGIHLDDYFYPYPIRDDDGQEVDFPDDQSWQQYQSNPQSPTLTREDWRRRNVDLLIEKMYRQTKQRKPWVKVGISPFGIWKPGYPEGVTGFDAHDKLYADARKWWREGWVDYFTPQLYWKIDSKGQSYPQLLDWWADENHQGRHLWPGNYASRLGFEKPWPVDELLNQIARTQNHATATGNVHFSMKTFTLDYGKVNRRLADGPYRTVALVPACPWLAPPDSETPATPSPILASTGDAANPCEIRFPETENDNAWQHVAQWHDGHEWQVAIAPSDAPIRLEQSPMSRQNQAPTNTDPTSGHATEYWVYAMDRYGGTSPPYRLSGTDAHLEPATSGTRDEHPDRSGIRSESK